MTTAQLWTRIFITYPMSQLQYTRIATYLSRSQTLPLDLYLDLRDPQWNWDEDTHPFHYQDMETLLRLTLSHVHRWREFELLTDTWAPIFTFLWYTRKIQSAPALERLSLSRCNAYFALPGESFRPLALLQPVSLFGGLALERLNDVTLIGVHVDWVGSPLRGLSQLDLRYHAKEVMPELSVFKDILAACPLLRCFSLIGWGPQLDTSLGLENQDIHRGSIRLHHLTSFSFGFVDIPYALALLPLFYLPSITSLGIEDVMKSLNPSDIRDASPLLQWLAAQDKLSFSDSPFPTSKIKNLKLHGLFTDVPTFQKLFSSFLGVRRLEICDTTDNALHALSPITGVALPCLELTDLYCQNSNSDVLVQVLADRAKVPFVSPLNKVELNFLRESTLPSSFVRTVQAALLESGVVEVDIR